MKGVRRLAQRPFRLVAMIFLLSVMLTSIGIHFTLLAVEDTTTTASSSNHPLTKIIMPRSSPFDHQTATIDKYKEYPSPLLSPMWTCSDLSSPASSSSSRGRYKKKLVFVHVFKTAGMTMRELFLRYALSCHLGIGMVSECSGLSWDSITTSTAANSTTTHTNIKNNDKEWWVNGFGSKQGNPCLMKAIHRTQDKNSISLSANMLKIDSHMLSELDILAGHLPLGVGAVWGGSASGYPQRQQLPQHDIQYVTFFREASTKFVSGIMYQKKDQNYAFDDIISLIHKRVRGELAKGKYREGYSAYLLTPQQKEYYYGHSSSNDTSIIISTVKDRTEQILRNLDHENILVGIVERMSESLELLQFVIDQEYEQTPLFESYGMKNSHDQTSGETAAAKVNNPSKFSTASVVAELKKDPEFYSLLQEYVKYDEQVYAHALSLHKLQYHALLQRRRRRQHQIM